MARLIDMEGTDFAGYRHFEMNLAKQGLVFIAGENKDSDSASSNGACKTGLFKALGWCLYGQAVDRRVGDEIIHRGQKCARVSVCIQDGDDTYTVIRERRKQAPKLFLERNGEAVKKPKEEIQLEIDRLIGVDWQGFRSTAMYGQGDRDRFVHPTTKDRDRKEILQRILKTGIFDLCFQEAKERRRSVVGGVQSRKDNLKWIKKCLEDVDLESIRAKVETFDDDRKQRSRELAAEARELAAQARSESESIEGASEALEAAEAELEARKEVSSAVSADLALAEKATLDLRSSTSPIAAEIQMIQRHLELLEGDTCPTCESPLTEGPGGDHRSDLEKRLGENRRLRDKLSKKIRKSDTNEMRFKLQLEESTKGNNRAHNLVSDLKANARLASKQRDVNRKLAKLAKSKVADAKACLSEPNPYHSELKVAERKVSELKRERKDAKAKLEELESILANLEFWTRGFGPSGIQSYALDSVMPFLTERANDHLHTLSDGDMSINFTTQRELKSSSEKRDQIGITWTIEGIENYPPSGGQWKKLEIATNFAMMDLVATREGSHVGILCLDECLDGLDPEGKQRVVALLHKLRSVRESIFVISHDAELSEVFEKTLIVTKENGVSELEVA